MCDHSTKLIAWLDRELEPTEMAKVQEHLHNCVDCRASLAKYEQASKAFADYCHAVITSESLPTRGRRWAPILAAAAAVVLVAVTVAFVLHLRVQPLRPATTPSVPPVTAVHVAPPSSGTEIPRPARRSSRPYRRSSPKARPASWLPPQPAVQVAIPADSMFPPGAVPDGVNFMADVSFAPDGFARQVRLRPRLTAVERRTIQP
jgi:Putative zinc-finger